MKMMPHWFRPQFERFVRDDRAQALAEYALVAAAFTLLLLASLRALSKEAGHSLNNTGANLTNMAVHS